MDAEKNLRKEELGKKRKVIQIAVSESSFGDSGETVGSTLALCDDGTMWRLYTFCDDSQDWEQLPPIPQD